MGVVIKQSFWGTFIAYLGVVLGYVNTLYFRAAYFSLEQIGLFTLITANAMMVSPISSFGAGSSYMKYFPSFDEEKKHRLFSFLFLVCVIGNGIILLVGYLLKDSIALRYVDTAPIYIDFLFVTGIVIVSNSFFDLFFNYSRSVLRVVVPSFLRDIYLRLGSFFLVIGYSLTWWNFDKAVIGLGIVYFSSFVVLFFQLIIRHAFHFDFRLESINTSWKKKLFEFGVYSMMLAGSFAVINNISYDQITAVLGSDMTGIFTTCFFIGVVVEMPKRNMAKVLIPLISKASKENDSQAIKAIYQRSSITMSIIGILFTIGIITNLQDLFDFIPKGSAFQAGFWVAVFVCLAKLTLMISSFSGEIINFSHLYKYNLYFQVLAAFMLVILNYFLIPIWGINGAGFSYVITMIFHTALKTGFVQYHFKISPLINSHLFLFIVSGATFALAFFFKPAFHPLINIGIRSMLITGVFVVLVYRFRISADINNLIHSTFERFLKIKLPK
ncbi:MAG: polysaccharide biosynthesis C-terminal domain-containing protein [Bacteroidota bacterium]